MFFNLSKVLWWFAAPANALLFLLEIGVLLLWTPWRRVGRGLSTLAVLLVVAAATLPVGSWMIHQLENRFPTVSTLPAQVDGIVVLGGSVDQFMTVARGQVSFDGSVERLTEFAGLARRYPEARLVFTGGSGDLFRQDMKEADVLGPFWQQIGLDGSRIRYERQSRNTYENAIRSFDLVHPRPGETWLLITSAFHMPRAIGCFRRAGWTVVPYPVDYQTLPILDSKLSLKVVGHLSSLDQAIHEWTGLFFYWLTDRTDSLFPGPVGS